LLLMDKFAQFLQLKNLPQKMHSGLQIQVLSLYRKFLRAIKMKSNLKDKRKEMTSIVRSKFEQKRNIPTNDVDTIEFFLQQGERQLVMFSKKSISSVEVKSFSFRSNE